MKKRINELQYYDTKKIKEAKQQGKKERIKEEIKFLVSICKYPTMYTKIIMERIECLKQEIKEKNE